MSGRHIIDKQVTGWRLAHTTGAHGADSSGQDRHTVQPSADVIRHRACAAAIYLNEPTGQGAMAKF